MTAHWAAVTGDSGWLRLPPSGLASEYCDHHPCLLIIGSTVLYSSPGINIMPARILFANLLPVLLHWHYVEVLGWIAVGSGKRWDLSRWWKMQTFVHHRPEKAPR